MGVESLAILVTVFFVSSEGLTVHKCCKLGFMLDKRFNCAAIPRVTPLPQNVTAETNSSSPAAANSSTGTDSAVTTDTVAGSTIFGSTDDLSWFPRSALYNDSTSEILNNEEQETVMDWLKTQWKRTYGMSFFSKCQRKELQFSYVNKSHNVFRILMKDESHVDVLTSSLGLAVNQSG